VSDSSKNLMEIYDDIDLCYKVLGLTFSDPPDQVDKVYRGLVEKYNNEMHSSDPEARQKAKENQEQLHDLYERITSSMIYKDYAREYEKYNSLKKELADKKQKEEKPAVMVRCPYCSKLISEKIKVCMYCHGKILSPMEMMLKKFCSKRNFVVMAVVLLCVVAGILLVLYPQLLNKLRG